MTAESSKISWSFSLALLCFALHYSALSDAAELQEITDIKFAFYSSQWGAPTDDGMRLIGFNQTVGELRLESIEFLKDEQQAEPIPIAINLSIPPMGYAEEESVDSGLQFETKSGLKVETTGVTLEVESHEMFVHEVVILEGVGKGNKYMHNLDAATALD